MLHLQSLFIICLFCLCNSVVYFHWPLKPHMQACRGGIAALHQFHHKLLFLNISTCYENFGVNCFDGAYLYNNNCSINNVASGDMIIIPEVFATPHLLAESLKDIQNVWQRTGARVIVWCLAGLQTRPPYYRDEVIVSNIDLTLGNASILANSFYIHDHYDLLHSPQHVLSSPLTPDYFTGIDRTFMSDSDLTRKRRLVLLDDDFLSRRTNVVDIYMALKPLDEFELIMLGGRSRSDLDTLFSEAMVVVDQYLPGLERVVQEAALYGAIPVIAREFNGRNHRDFPFMSELLFDPWSQDDMLRAVEYAMMNYKALVNSPMMLHYRSMVQAVDRHNTLAVSALSMSARVTFVLLSCPLSQHHLAIAFALSVLHHNPWASVEVHVEDLTAFLAEHASLLSQLHLMQGVTDSHGGAAFHSLRFRTARACGSEYVSTDLNGDRVWRERVVTWRGVVPEVMHGDLLLRVAPVGWMPASVSSELVGVWQHHCEIWSGHQWQGGAHSQAQEKCPLKLVLYGKTHSESANDDIHYFRGEDEQIMIGELSQVVKESSHAETSPSSLLSVRHVLAGPVLLLPHEQSIVTAPELQMNTQLLHSCSCRHLNRIGDSTHDDLCRRNDSVSSHDHSCDFTFLAHNGLWATLQARVSRSLAREAAIDVPFAPATPTHKVTQDQPNESYLESSLHDLGKSLTVVLTDTPVVFTYACPTLDKDSNDGVVNHRVLEPGLTRLWQFIISNYLLKRDHQHRGVMRPLVIDVGGNFGYYSLLGASLGAEVVAFEPVPAFANLIKLNKQLNPELKSYIHLHQVAVSNFTSASTNPTSPLQPNWSCSRGRAEDCRDLLHIQVPRSGSLGTARVKGLLFEESHEQVDEVEVAALALDHFFFPLTPAPTLADNKDEVVQESLEHPSPWRQPESSSHARAQTVTDPGTGKSRVALMKIDVEGYELLVLEGARQLIKTHRPHMLVELQTKLLLHEAGVRERWLAMIHWLRGEQDYSVYYLMWERVRYAPPYDWTVTKEGLMAVPELVDATALDAEEIISLPFAANFWLSPKPLDLQ